MNVLTEFLASPVAERLGLTVAHSLWQIGIVAALAFFALECLRRKSPNARYAVACGAMSAMFALPAVTFFAFEIDPPLLRESENSAPVVAPLAPPTEMETVSRAPLVFPAEITSGHMPEGESPASGSPADVGERPSIASASLDPAPGIPAALVGNPVVGKGSALLTQANDFLAKSTPWLATVWLLGVIGFATRNFGGWMVTQRFRRLGTEPSSPRDRAILDDLRGRLGLRNPVRMLESDLAETPIVFGWLKPVILTPIGLLTNLSNAQVEALLAHELAHVRRHDYLVNMLQAVAETVLFYHPAVWWISRRIRLERELCCDDVAVSICRDRVAYAEALATIEESRGTIAFGLGAGEKPLVSRIRRVLGLAPAHRSRRAALGASVGAIMLAGVVVIAACSSPEDKEDATKSARAESSNAGTNDEADEGSKKGNASDVLSNTLTIEVGEVGEPESASREWLRQRVWEDIRKGASEATHFRARLDGVYAQLDSTDPAIRSGAGAYLLEFVRAMSAEQDSRSSALGREISRALIEEIPRNLTRREQSGEEMLPIIDWFIANTSSPRLLSQAIRALRNVEGEKADTAILDLVRSDRHYARWHAIAEATKRGLEIDDELANALSQDLHREIRLAAGKLRPGSARAFDSANAVKESPMIRQMVERVMAISPAISPADAEFVAVTGEQTGISRHRSGITRDQDVSPRGWVVERNPQAGTATILTPYGWLETYPSDAIVETSPTDEIERFEKNRAQERQRQQGNSNNEDSDPWLADLKKGGIAASWVMRSEFYQIFLGCWLYQNEQWDLAARALLPLFDEKVEDRFVFETAEHWLSVLAGHEMLLQFAEHADYPKAIEQARRIDQHFPGSLFHSLALDLIDELPRRSGDFTVLKLPEIDEWNRLKLAMTRERQIDYLCERLHLIRSEVGGRPGHQFDRSTSPPRRLFNPHSELKGMSLAVPDIPALASHLAARRHLLVVWANEGRTFVAERHVVTTRQLISELINEIAKHDLCGSLTESNPAYTDVGEREVEAEIGRIQSWAREQALSGGNDLLVAALRSGVEGGANFNWIRKAAEKLIDAEDKRVVPILKDYWKKQEYLHARMRLLAMLSRIDPSEAAGLATELFTSGHFEARALAAKTASLGPAYASARKSLARIPMSMSVGSDNTYDYLKAIEALIADKSEPSQELLRKITVFDPKTPLVWQSDTRWKVIRALAKGGHVQGLRYYQALLAMDTPTEKSIFADMPPADLGDLKIISHYIARELVHEYAPDDPAIQRIKKEATSIEARLEALKTWIAEEITASTGTVAGDPRGKLEELVQAELSHAEFDKETWKIRLTEKPEKLYVKLRTITLLKKTDQGNPAAPKKRIHEIRGRLIEGADFASEARAHSQDSRAENGGAWGWIDEDTFSNPLSAAAFSTKENAVSAVVEDKRAYYLLLVEERRKGGYVGEPTAIH